MSLNAIVFDWFMPIVIMMLLPALVIFLYIALYELWKMTVGGV